VLPLLDLIKLIAVAVDVGVGAVVGQVASGIEGELVLLNVVCSLSAL